MKPLEVFFSELDALWVPRPAARLRLRIIGSTALMLKTDYERTTKDSDVLETSLVTGPVRSRLEALGGKGSRLYERHRVYIDVVPAGLAFLPHAPRCHALTALNPRLESFEFEVLDVIDVVVSKLMRFSTNDRSDIEAMIDRALVPHEAFIERFRSAVDVCAHGAYADELPRCVRNLNRVERDFYGVDATEIELPSWVDDG